MKTFRRISLQKRHILVLISALIVFSSRTMDDVFELTKKIYVEITDLMESSDFVDICNVSDPLKLTLAPFDIRRDIQEKPLYKWDDETDIQLDVSFEISLYTSQMLGGILSDIRNTKFIMLGCLTTQTAMAFLSPVVIQNIKGNWKILMGWYIVYGLSEGPIMPAVFSVFGQWIPDGEKTISIAMLTAITSVAHIALKLFGVTVINGFGHWSAAFYVFGCFGVLSSLLWFFFCYPSPESHPTITLKEKRFLRRRIGPYYDKKNKNIPWMKMALSVPFWTLVLNFMGWQWAWYTILDEYPIYLEMVLKVNFTKHYLFVLVLPLLFMIIASTFSAIICDILIRRDVVDITTMRKIYSNMGSMGTNSFTVAASYAGCYQTLPSVLYSVILGFMALFGTGAMVNILDLAPNYGGTIFGFADSLSYLLYFIRPFASQKFINENTLTGWQCVFWCSFGVCAFVNLIYALFCQATPTPWNIPQDLLAKEEIELDEYT